MASDFRYEERFKDFTVVKTNEVSEADVGGYVKEIFYNVEPTNNEVALDQLTIGQGWFGAGYGLRHPGLIASDYPCVIMESTCELKSHEEWLNELETVPESISNELMDDENAPWNDARWQSLLPIVQNQFRFASSDDTETLCEAIPNRWLHIHMDAPETPLSIKRYIALVRATLCMANPHL